MLIFQIRWTFLTVAISKFLASLGTSAGMIPASLIPILIPFRFQPKYLK